MLNTLPEPAAPIQEEPTAIDALTNFHLIHGMRILDCVDETSNERLAIFMVKYHGGYVKALSVMAQSISDYPSSVELNSVEIEKDQLRFARLFVVKLGGYKNAVGNIRELQRVDQLQKSGNEDALKTTGMQSAALTAALDMTPTTETTTVPSSPSSARTIDASTNHDPVEEMRKHNCGRGPFE